MRGRAARALALVLALVAGCGAVAEAAHPGFAQALTRALPSTLGVYGVGEDGADDAEGAASAPHGAQVARRRPIRVGAGFLIDARGLAVTAAHVVAGTSRVTVQLSDERLLPAQVLAMDEAADVALIRLPLKLPVAPAIGRAASLRPGDWVLAIGEPYGLARTVTAGIVGGRQRHFADEPEMLYIQSDLTLNPGSSGGPLLDSEGMIVGMNVRAAVGEYGTSGISLSLPIELVLQIARELQDGSIERPRLNASFHDLDPATALANGQLHARGARIGRVTEGGLAARVGLCMGDIVVGFNGRAIGNSVDLARALLAWRQAAGTRITIRRDQAFRELRID